MKSDKQSQTKIFDVHFASFAIKVGIYIVPAADGEILLNDMTALSYK